MVRVRVRLGLGLGLKRVPAMVVGLCPWRGWLVSLVLDGVLLSLPDVYALTRTHTHAHTLTTYTCAHTYSQGNSASRAFCNAGTMHMLILAKKQISRSITVCWCCPDLWVKTPCSRRLGEYTPLKSWVQSCVSVCVCVCMCVCL